MEIDQEESAKSNNEESDQNQQQNVQDEQMILDTDENEQITFDELGSQLASLGIQDSYKDHDPDHYGEFAETETGEEDGDEEEDDDEDDFEGEDDEDDDFYDEDEDDYKRLDRVSSTISISSKPSVAMPGDPSKLRLFSKCIESEYHRKLTKLEPSKAANKSTVADLHRSQPSVKKLHRISLKGPVERYAQTRDMTYLTRQQGDTFFKYLYAQREYENPVEISSRDESRDAIIDTAEKLDPKIDVPTIEPKPSVRWVNRHKIFPPLIDEYYKVESFWTGGTYKGEYVNRLFNHGTYQYGTGAKYESEFKEGHMHSKKHLGKITYPRGDTFDGQWRKGRYESGKICFADGLQFEPHNWNYCTGNDRRFYTERQMGMMRGGKALYNDRLPPPWIPPGSYDVGYGVYDPCTRKIFDYDKRLIKLATDREHGWFTKFCKKSPLVQERYEPTFLPDRLPDKYADKHYKM